MKLLKTLICLLLALSLVGCAVSSDPNPMIRYATNLGTSLAVPGMVVFVAAGAASSDKDEGDMSEQEKEFEDHLGKTVWIGVGVAAAGFVAGALVGGTIGFIKWASNGFKDDDMTGYSTEIPEDAMPPKDEAHMKPDTVNIDMSK